MLWIRKLLTGKLLTRCIARAKKLHTRIYLSQDGRAWLVSGLPEPEKLLASLAHARRQSRGDLWTTPTELGYPVRWDGELSEEFIADSHAALNEWEDTLRERAGDPRVDTALVEIGILRARLGQCAQWKVDAAARDSEDRSPYLLNATQEHSLAQALARYPLPSADRWLARLVFWLAGRRAMLRFTEAVARLASEHVEVFATAHRVVAALATLAICDGATAPLPIRFLVKALSANEENDIEAASMQLLLGCRGPGYEALLRLLSHTDFQDPDSFQTARQLLVAGMNHADVAWLVAEDLTAWAIDSKVSPTLARRAYRVLGTRKITPRYAVTLMMRAAEAKTDVECLRDFLTWVERLTPATANTRFASVIQNGLTGVVLPALEQFHMYEELRRWLNAAQMIGNDPVEGWLQRITHCQTLAGLSVSVPKSVRKPLERRAVEAGELAFLQPLVEQGQATTAQARRCALLTQRLADEPQRKDLARAAEEAFIMVAWQSLRKLVEQKCAVTWQAHAGLALTQVPASRVRAFASWIEAMKAKERVLHDDILAAWRDSPAYYKQGLPCNHDWLRRAEDAGIDARDWLRASPVTTIIDGREFELRFADDPREIFRMGTYFDTCLGFGQCNQLSVLANAAHANKQVVYLYGQREGRRVAVARMLVAINRDFQVVRYQAYVPFFDASRELRAACEAALIDYAAQRAFRAGLTLADAGAPESFDNHFWYDDGCVAWPVVTIEACQAQREYGCWSVVVGALAG